MLLSLALHNANNRSWQSKMCMPSSISFVPVFVGICVEAILFSSPPQSLVPLHHIRMVSSLEVEVSLFSFFVISKQFCPACLLLVRWMLRVVSLYVS